MSGHTCGMACWAAQDDICHCSCGGVNHGVLRREGGVQPVRSKKMSGVIYELHSVHFGYREIMELLQRNELPNNSVRSVPTRREIDAWPELTAFRNQTAVDRIMKPPVCVWVRSEKYN